MLAGLSGNVLITGGSGYLGRGFLRRIREKSWPAKVTIYSRDETKQYEVKHRFPEVTCLLGDVRDANRLEAAMVGMDIVIHAGAVKYIPEAEANVAEAIAVNVEGSLNIARAAARAGVRTVVGISTDKATSPLNTYGATKMLMERLFAEANRWSETDFMTVRYGNVVGSTGSVIPMFVRQIRESGKVSITDPKMTRFWLDVDQAVDLVVKAIEMADEFKGAVVIPPCGSMTNGQLAQTVWKWVAGPGEEFRMQIIGVRPGEKIHEALYSEQEAGRILLKDGFFALMPVGTKIDNLQKPGMIHNTYTSDRPSRVISDEEMLRMITRAEKLWL